MRDESSVSTRVFDLACVVVLGLLLTFLASVVARAHVPALNANAHAASAPARATGANAADCDSPAKPDAPAVPPAAVGAASGDGAPAKTGETAMAGGLPASMSVGACADNSAKPAAPAAAAQPPQH